MKQLLNTKNSADSQVKHLCSTLQFYSVFLIVAIASTALLFKI